MWFARHFLTRRGNPQNHAQLDVIWITELVLVRFEDVVKTTGVAKRFGGDGSERFTLLNDMSAFSGIAVQLIG